MTHRYSESEIIAKLFKPVAGDAAHFLDDDAAALPAPGKGNYVVTTDALVAGVHFFADDPPALIAKKALRVNLSDLAAKGARPVAFLLTLALPADWTNDWLAAFADGLHEDADAYGCRLIGGDTTATPGPLMISITAFGETDGDYPTRSGARPGDAIFVSGTIGDAALGLALRRDPARAPGLSREARAALLERYLLPQPRVALAPLVRANASAAMDVSDGLAGDLAKLLRASSVGAVVDLPLIPLSPAARAALACDPALLETALTGGDDYEILFCARADFAPGAEATRIGAITAGASAPLFRGADKKPVSFSRLSFEHF